MRDQGSGDRHAHLHAARELAWIGALEAVEAHHPDRLLDPRGRLLSGNATQLQGEEDVLEHGRPRHERRLLEHEADVASRQPGAAIRAWPLDAAARDFAQPRHEP